MLDESNLRPYQHLMIEHMINTPKCAAWAFMGAGKSVSTLTAIDRMMMAGIIEKPTLIIAPLRVARDVWSDEVHGWSHLSHLKVSRVIGSQSQRILALQTKADIYTVNFENLEWLIGLLWDRWPFDMIVVDEATKLKSLRASVKKHPKSGTEYVSGKGGKRALGLLKVVYQHKPSRFVELSGTPAPNGLQDLWGQVFFLDYGKRLGNIYSAFAERWFTQSFDGWSLEPTKNAQVEIQDKVKDICLSLKSEDWFDVAAPIVRTLCINLPIDVRKKYREMERHLYTEIKGNPVEAFNAGARTMKCLQMASGAVYVGDANGKGKRQWVEVHTAKLDALEEIIEECSGASLLVGYTFKSDLERILKRFPKAVHFSQSGDILKRWNSGKIHILVAHPSSVGHGLSLQHGGSILVRFSSDWNNEQFDQMLERIGPVRQAQSGYKRSVFEYRIIAHNTIDEDVYESHETKRSVQECLMMGLSRRIHGTP